MTTTAFSDAELLEQARAGDEAAFTELYVRHQAAARRLAAGYPRAGDPDDLVNGAFERVLGALRRGAGPTEAFRAYLFVTLRRLATDQIAKLHDDPVDDVPEPVRAEERDPPLEHAERNLVITAYESLPDRTQAVLWQTEVEGRQPRELAGLLGMSANAAAALAYRAREKLRQAYLQAHLQAAPRPQCEPHRSRLGAYIRDGLGNRDQTATAVHLDGCDACQSLVAELLDVNRLLRRGLLPLFEATAAQVAATAAAVAGGATVGGGGVLLLGRRLASKLKSNGGVVAGAIALAAAVAFALVATRSDEQTLLPGSSPEVVAPPADSAADPPPSPATDEPEPEVAPDEPAVPPTPSPPEAVTTSVPPPSVAPDPLTPPPPPVPTIPPTAPPSSPPPPGTSPPPRPALVVVWVEVQGRLQITLTNNTGLPTDGLLLEVNLSGGAVVAGPPSNCETSLSLFTAVSCGVGSLDPGDSVVVRIPVTPTAMTTGQSASTRTCEAPLLDLVCLDVLAEVTTALGA